MMLTAQLRVLARRLSGLLVGLPVFAVLAFILYDSRRTMVDISDRARQERLRELYLESRNDLLTDQIRVAHLLAGNSSSEPGQGAGGGDGDGGPAPNRALGDLTAPELSPQLTQAAPDYTYRSLLTAKPPPYLDTYHNPCWLEPLPTTNPYNESYYYTDLFLYPRFHDVLEHMAQTWESRLKTGYKWRLRCLPYFYVVGFAKCATSDLYDALLEHPRIVSTSSKEIHYWSKARVKDGKTDAFGFVPLRNYIDLFDEAADEISKIAEQRGDKIYHPAIVGDGTPSTVDYSGQWRNLPENDGYDAPKYTTGDYIAQVTPQAHIIIIVRNPTERLYSDYKYFHERVAHSPEEFHALVVDALDKMNTCLSNRTIWACVNDRQLYLNIKRFTLFNSIYFPYLNEWGKVFPPEQFHILRFEDYKTDRAGAIDSVLRSLGLDPMPDDLKAQVTNKTVSNKNLNDAAMLPETRIILDEFFKPFNEQLSDLLKDSRFMWAK